MFEKEAEEIEKEAIKWVKDVFPNDEFKQSGISRALVEFGEVPELTKEQIEARCMEQLKKDCEEIRRKYDNESN